MFSSEHLQISFLTYQCPWQIKMPLTMDRSISQWATVIPWPQKTIHTKHSLPLFTVCDSNPTYMSV